MQKSLSNALFFILLVALFFAAVLVNNLLFKGVNLDLTENRVYSLSAGTESILTDLEEPINLYFFFSDSSSKGMTSLRNYAEQVETILRKYEARAQGKINLEVIDPEPFSEAEDRASTFGLTGVSAGAANDAIYFGLAGTNALDDTKVIGFFDPSKESFLEYDISKLIYQLSNPAPVKVSVVTALPLEGGQNPLTGQPEPANVAYTQLTQLFDVQLVDVSADKLPEETQVLILWHPQGLGQDLLYAVDQYLMAGGKALAFVDPHYESDQMAMLGGAGANASSLPLLSSYGIQVNLDKVVLDAQLGLEIRGQQGNVIRHLGYLGLGEAQINDKDITTADLDSINGASFADITVDKQSGLRMVPLLSSSVNTATIDSEEYALQRDPQSLSNNIEIQEQKHTLAARVVGSVKSHFAQDEEVQGADFKESTDSLNLAVFADADILSDRFWVQQSNFFGQMVFNPFANNGDLLTNLVENYGGSEGLIGIRSRGTFARPFIKVQELSVIAEEKFREQEQLLQQRLQETEAQLAQLQSQQTESLTLTPEQQATINNFVEQRVEIRKALRDVQFQLDKDIDSLGNILAIINIVVAPVSLVLLLFVIARLSRRKARLG
ncbi:Gldg family protein [Glaciecola sp. 1036]|uniref:Gldg family protein n=1 Tax=Alteromonadaceae TaxID=72275 RepID=UPI003D05915D